MCSHSLQFLFQRSHCEALKVVYGEDDIRVASVVNELASHLSKMVSIMISQGVGCLICVSFVYTNMKIIKK